MRMYRRQLLKEFFPFFILGIFFFTLILVLADVFANLWRYLNEDVSFKESIKVSLLFAPKALTYAIPIGAMFAAAFALGNLGANNELIAVFGSGVSLIRFVLPMLVTAAILSLGTFIFEDRVAIPRMKERNILSNSLLGVQSSTSRTKPAVISQGGTVLYYADYYNDENQFLDDVTIVFLTKEGQFQMRIDAERAAWESTQKIWLLEGCRIYTLNKDGDIEQKVAGRYKDERINEIPSSFRLDTQKLEEMNAREAGEWIQKQKRTGLPYKGIQAQYYQRYTFALTPFLVVFFAGALGGRFRKNILLMSLLASLGLASGWYVARMIFTLFSQFGVLSPLAGALIPYFIFLAAGMVFFKYAKT